MLNYAINFTHNHIKSFLTVCTGKCPGNTTDRRFSGPHTSSIACHTAVFARFSVSPEEYKNMPLAEKSLQSFKTVSAVDRA